MKLVKIFSVICITFFFNAQINAQNAKLILAGTFKGYGDIYSPEIVGNLMYFGGWYNINDYPCDAIWVTRLNDLTHAKRILRLDSVQVNDPSIAGNKMFMTYNPDVYLPDLDVPISDKKVHKTYGPKNFDITDTKVAVSTIINSDSVSQPIPIIQNAWLPSAILRDSLYLYYNIAGTSQLMRATLKGDSVVNKVLTTFDSRKVHKFYPVNVNVQFYNGLYYLIGDYTFKSKGKINHALGLWLSRDGVNFTNYKYNPVIVPDDDNIIARTAFFKKIGNKLKIWFGQQKKDWWKNAIFYKEVILKKM